MDSTWVRKLIVQAARLYDGCPYLWGGAVPWEGFDCSGYVIFVLRHFDLLPQRGDWAARDLARLFKPTTNPQPGDLALFGAPVVTHIGFYVGGGNVISAAGGGPRIRSRQEAEQAGARVKVHNVWGTLAGYRNVLERAA